MTEEPRPSEAKKRKVSGKAWELKAAMPQRLGHSRAGAGSGQWWEVVPEGHDLGLAEG